MASKCIASFILGISLFCNPSFGGDSQSEATEAECKNKVESILDKIKKKEYFLAGSFIKKYLDGPEIYYEKSRQTVRFKNLIHDLIQTHVPPSEREGSLDSPKMVMEIYQVAQSQRDFVALEKIVDRYRYFSFIPSLIHKIAYEHFERGRAHLALDIYEGAEKNGILDRIPATSPLRAKIAVLWSLAAQTLSRAEEAERVFKKYIQTSTISWPQQKDWSPQMSAVELAALIKKDAERFKKNTIFSRSLAYYLDRRKAEEELLKQRGWDHLLHNIFKQLSPQDENRFFTQYPRFEDLKWSYVNFEEKRLKEKVELKSLSGVIQCRDFPSDSVTIGAQLNPRGSSSPETVLLLANAMSSLEYYSLKDWDADEKFTKIRERSKPLTYTAYPIAIKAQQFSRGGQYVIYEVDSYSWVEEFVTGKEVFRCSGCVIADVSLSGKWIVSYQKVVHRQGQYFWNSSQIHYLNLFHTESKKKFELALPQKIKTIHTTLQPEVILVSPDDEYIVGRGKETRSGDDLYVIKKVVGPGDTVQWIPQPIKHRNVLKGMHLLGLRLNERGETQAVALKEEEIKEGVGAPSYRETYVYLGLDGAVQKVFPVSEKRFTARPVLRATTSSFKPVVLPFLDFISQVEYRVSPFTAKLPGPEMVFRKPIPTHMVPNVRMFKGLTVTKLDSDLPSDYLGELSPKFKNMGFRGYEANPTQPWFFMRQTPQQHTYFIKSGRNVGSSEICRVKIAPSNVKPIFLRLD